MEIGFGLEFFGWVILISYWHLKKNRIWCRQLRNVVNFSHATQKPQRWQPLGFSCINENYDRHKKEAVWNSIQLHDLSGNRTRVYAVRGRRLDRLTNRPESRRQDSNLRPLRPERSALPNWATPRCSWAFVLRCLPATCIYYHDSEKNASVFWKKCKFLKQIFRNVGRSPEKPYFMRENGISG